MTSYPADVPEGTTGTEPRHAGAESADQDEPAGLHGAHEAGLASDDRGLGGDSEPGVTPADDTPLPADDTDPVNAAGRDPLNMAGSGPDEGAPDGEDDDDADDDDDEGSGADDDYLDEDELETGDPDLIVVEDSMVVSSDATPHAREPFVMEPVAADPADADASTADASTTDTSAADTSMADTSTADTSMADTSTADASMADTSTADASAADASVADASAADVSMAEADSEPAPQVADMAGGTTQFQERWLAIQSDFVDDPHRSVAAAAELVQEAIESLVARVRRQESSMRGTWDGPSADTEILRKALVDYRSFLDRIAAM
jgi:hypothetical protein